MTGKEGRERRGKSWPPGATDGILPLMTEPAPEPPLTPASSYRIVKKLASGGMGEIYLARLKRDAGFEKELVLKKLLPIYAQNQSFVRMFLNEARLASKLNHSNIIQIFDLGKLDDSYFIAMEYLSGENLSDILDEVKSRRQRIPPSAVVEMIAQMLRGLDYAHRKTDSDGTKLHIVHRDISPKNLLVSFEGELKIIDFGLAKATLYDNKTDAGTLKGSYSYMSPEQISGKPLDFRTDLFSAACVAFELFTLEKLFPSRLGLKPMFEKIAAGDISCVVDGEDLWNRVPEAAREPLRKALAYHVEDRYSSTSAMLEAFEQLRVSKACGEGPALKTWMEDFFSEKIAIRKHNREAERTAVASQPVSVSGAENPVPVGAIDSLYRPAVMLLVFILVTGLAWTGKQIYRKSTTPKLAAASVVTDPPGARMTLDGHPVEGRTPVEIHELVAGRPYPVRFEAENHKPLVTTLVVEGPGTQKLQYSLEREKGRIFAATVPAGADILLNGKDTGLTTPAELKDIELFAPNKVAFRLEGYRSEEIDFTLESVLLRRITVEMVRAETRLAVRSKPDGAQVLVDGKEAGVTPWVWEKAEPGKIYRIEVRKPGHRSYSEEVFMPFSGTPVELEIPLDAVRARVSWAGRRIAGLTLNGKSGQPAVTDLGEGNYLFRGQLAGGQELTLRLEIQQQNGGSSLGAVASVNVKPYAQVDLNGRSVRTTPVSDLRFSRGTNKLAIQPPEGDRTVFEVVLP